MEDYVLGVVCFGFQGLGSYEWWFLGCNIGRVTRLVSTLDLDVRIGGLYPRVDGTVLDLFS